MKRYIFAASALAAICALPAIAGPINHAIQVKATVGEFCSLGSPSLLGTGFSGESETGSTFTVGIEGLETSLTQGSIAFANASCNANATVSISRNGLKKSGINNPTEGFKDEIPYTFQFTWGTWGNSVDEELQPNINGNNAITNIPVGPIHAEASMTIMVAADFGPLIKGEYTDTVTVTITPSS